eukprot:9305507-Lingulodinium_polyedra.AAC.1
MLPTPTEAGASRSASSSFRLRRHQGKYPRAVPVDLVVMAPLDLAQGGIEAEVPCHHDLVKLFLLVVRNPVAGIAQGGPIQQLVQDVLVLLLELLEDVSSELAGHLWQQQLKMIGSSFTAGNLLRGLGELTDDLYQVGFQLLLLLPLIFFMPGRLHPLLLAAPRLLCDLPLQGLGHNSAGHSFGSVQGTPGAQQT